jgi:DNA polymerase III delta subunit
MKSFPARTLIDQARRFSADELSDAVVRLARLDLAVKGESRLDPRFELELALAEITGG